MPTDNKTIEEYNKKAKTWAATKRDSSSIFHTYLEKPAMYGKLPSLENKTVLCIGSGTGEEVEYLYSQGAKKVVGVDIAEGLIEVAKKTYPDYEFHVMDMEKLDFPAESFDYAFSSLTMHYVLDWTKTLLTLHKILKPSGVFLFSITHPFFSAVERHEDEKEKVRILGFKDYKTTENVEIYGNYFDPKAFEVKINNALTVSNCHRPLSALIKDITKSGFEVLDIVEPKAVSESKEEHKKFWEIHQRIPEFIVFEIKRTK